MYETGGTQVSQHPKIMRRIVSFLLVLCFFMLRNAVRP